jgi:ParB family chromosome partitioning protein
MSTDTPTDTATTAFAYLDPRVLAAHPSNVRRDTGDIRALVRSIRALGVLQPLVVVRTDDGGRRIVAGHRRCAAAIEADLATVPCIVTSGMDAATQVAAMLAENTRRAGLSAGEEAAGYEQLAVLGLSDTAIAKATGATRPRVAKARKVAASETATAVAHRYALTLDQALVLAEFDDDREAIKQLTVCAKERPAAFEHLASRLRQARETREQYETTVRKLTMAGVAVLEDPPECSYTDLAKPMRLDELRHDGKDLTPTNHRRCPGHAAYVYPWQPERPEYVCLDPNAHGHTSRHTQQRPSGDPPPSENRTAERREVIENNKAWRAAEPVRRQHIRGLLGRKTAPKGWLRYLVTEITGDPDAVGTGDDERLAELLGVDATDGRRQVGADYAAKLPDARLTLALLARVAADVEQTMGVHTWRHPSPRAARWLTFLASTGYTLADIEQLVVNDTAAERAPDHEDDGPGAA